MFEFTTPQLPDGWRWSSQQREGRACACGGSPRPAPTLVRRRHRRHHPIACGSRGGSGRTRRSATRPRCGLAVKPSRVRYTMLPDQSKPETVIGAPQPTTVLDAVSQWYFPGKIEVGVDRLRRGARDRRGAARLSGLGPRSQGPSGCDRGEAGQRRRAASADRRGRAPAGRAGRERGRSEGRAGDRAMSGAQDRANAIARRMGTRAAAPPATATPSTGGSRSSATRTTCRRSRRRVPACADARRAEVERNGAFPAAQPARAAANAARSRRRRRRLDSTPRTSSWRRPSRRSDQTEPVIALRGPERT